MRFVSNAFMAAVVVCAVGAASSRGLAQTMTSLGDLPGGGLQSSALAVSADGSVVVGTGSSDKSNHAAVRWTKQHPQPATTRSLMGILSPTISDGSTMAPKRERISSWSIVAAIQLGRRAPTGTGSHRRPEVVAGRSENRNEAKTTCEPVIAGGRFARP